ncbi:MAG: hypothetical protein KDD64_12065, partial [Bdellovibrionales bacterium]|nr:hypothetical protein [Bdellovibrionales bacterium]
RQFRPLSESFASGWMRIRGFRRRRGVERGFVLSDHADWNGLIEAIQMTGASRVTMMHGDSHLLVNYLREGGLDITPLGSVDNWEGKRSATAHEEDNED